MARTESEGARQELAGRRIVVTGASSGIGASVVRSCAGQGARVIAIARREARLRQLADEAGSVIPLVADLSVPGAAREAVMESAAMLDGLDVLVNNAGLYLVGGVTDGDPRDWRKMFDLNVLSSLEASHAALPYLRKSPNAHVVNIGSIGGRRVARPSTAVYSATKSALYAISEGMRQELHPEGIRVSVVAPGVVRTEMGAGTSDAELLAQVREKQEAVGIRPEAVANAVMFALTQPPDVAISDIVVLPTAQSF